MARINDVGGLQGFDLPQPELESLEDVRDNSG